MLSNEQIKQLSEFLNRQANLPVHIEEIAGILRGANEPKEESVVKKIIKKVTKKK